MTSSFVKDLILKYLKAVCFLCDPVLNANYLKAKCFEKIENEKKQHQEFVRTKQ